MLKFASPKLVIKNISNKSITVLNNITLKPKQEVDVFQYFADISESTVIDALRAPKGQLYVEHVIRENIEIKECSLVTFEALTVTDDKLNAVNSGKPGQVLSINNNGQFEWVYRSESGIMNLDPPLLRAGEKISLPKADELTNGYLSKEDFRLFKGRSKGFRIWQFQDVRIPKSPIKLDAFENGNGLQFDKNYIVNHSAVIVDRNNLEKPPFVYGSKLKSIFGISEEIKVHQHIGDTILLDRDPPADKECRVYFLVVLPENVDIPIDYVQPPRFVRNERIDLMDIIDIDTGGAKQIRGTKNFKNNILVSESIGIRTENPEFPLDVNGRGKLSSLQLVDGASSHYVLLSNSIGEASWSPSPVVSYVPPNNCYAGQLWLKTPEYELYVFDGVRKKWLSTDSYSVKGGNNSTICSNAYAKTVDNLSTDISGCVLPYDATLVEITASSEYNQSWVAELHVSNSLIEGAILPVINKDRGIGRELNVDLHAGDKVQLFVNGENISMPRIEAIFRKRV